MITTFEQSTELYKIINGSQLKTEINGGIYKEVRPTDSNLEDIVINAILIDNELVQTGVGNVNIHVPTLSSGMPNMARMGVLAAMAFELLKYGTISAKPIWFISEDGLLSFETEDGTGVFVTNSTIGNNATFFIESQTIEKEPSVDRWFVNIRVRFKFHNII